MRQREQEEKRNGRTSTEDEGLNKTDAPSLDYLAASPLQQLAAASRLLDQYTACTQLLLGSPMRPFRQLVFYDVENQQRTHHLRS